MFRDLVAIDILQGILDLLGIEKADDILGFELKMLSRRIACTVTLSVVFPVEKREQNFVYYKSENVNNRKKKNFFSVNMTESLFW